MTGNGTSVPPDGSIRGRFALVPAEETTGAMLYWAIDLCDRCLHCGCGNQRLPFDLTPAGSMRTFLRLRQLQKDGIRSE
jgi:hypothetical protein